MQPVIQYPRPYRDLPLMFIISGQHIQYGYDILPCDITECIGPGKNLHHLVHGVGDACSILRVCLRHISV